AVDHLRCTVIRQEPHIEKPPVRGQLGKWLASEHEDGRGTQEGTDIDRLPAYQDDEPGGSPLPDLRNQSQIDPGLDQSEESDDGPLPPRQIRWTRDPVAQGHAVEVLEVHTVRTQDTIRPQASLFLQLLLRCHEYDLRASGKRIVH